MSGHVIQTAPGSGGAGGNPAGSDKEIQYNDGGVFGAEAGFEYDKASNQMTAPGVTITQDVIASGDLTPAQITATQNDYAPTGHATAFTFRLSTDASRQITGLAGGVAGRLIIIANVGSFNIVIVDESGSSTADNRFALVGNLTIAPDRAVVFRYDDIENRWKAILHLPDPFIAGTIEATTQLTADAAFSALGDSSFGSGDANYVIFTGGNIRLGSSDTPAQITSDQNNYTPANERLVYRLSTDASRNITGWAAGSTDYPIKVLLNVGSFNIVLVDESASSLAANRFALDGNMTLAPGVGVWMIYDEVAERWRVLAMSGGGATTNALLDGSNHTDTLAGSVADGDVIIGNVTPKWSRLAITVPAANILNVLGVANGETRPSWKSIFDGTNPADLGVAAPGTSLIAAHRDHVHLDPVTAHVAAGDPHTGYRLESADHSHASTGLQGGTVSHDVLTDVSANDHHNQAHALDGADHTLSGATDGHVLKATGATTFAFEADYATLLFIIDGGGSAITTGIKGDLEVPFGCVVERATALADQSGSIVVDIWKDTYANYPPTDADSITASAPVTISTATKSQDATLTGWTTTLAAGDILRFNVDSITTVTRVTISLRVRKT